MKGVLLFCLMLVAQLVHCDDDQSLKESIEVGRRLFKEYRDQPNKVLEKEEIRKLLMTLFHGNLHEMK